MIVLLGIGELLFGLLRAAFFKSVRGLCHPQLDDINYECQGVNVYIDPKSLVYVDGTEMAYVKQGLNEGFEFRKPNVKGECGCGESFTV